MRQFAEFIVAMVPIDAEARRAIDETLADWRYEGGMAGSTLARALVAATGLWALVSVVVRAALVDVQRAGT